MQLLEPPLLFLVLLRRIAQFQVRLSQHLRDCSPFLTGDVEVLELPSELFGVAGGLGEFLLH